MHYFLHQLKKRVAAAAAALGDIALFLGIVLIGGLGSSWYMVQAGSSLTTVKSGPWVAWTSAARGDADPYTRAHFMREGSLPLTSEIATTYLARTDSAGGKLQPSCEYAIEGRDIPSSWWSLTVFDDRGVLIQNPLQRYGYTSETVALRPDGSFSIALAREARPGNWAPTGGARRLALLLTVIEPPKSTDGASTWAEIAAPGVRRVSCR